MQQIKCKVFLDSQEEHCQQVYTGLAELANVGFLDLETEITEAFKKREFVAPFVKIILDNDLIVIYDLSDAKEIVAKNELELCDIYFKRSYNQQYLNLLSLSDKVQPFGLNYLVYSANGFWKEKVQYAPRLKQKLIMFLRSQPYLSRMLSIQDSLYACEIKNFESLPLINEHVKILFLVRAWDPDLVDTEEKRQHRIKMNTQRAEIIIKLRDEFGERFIGGFLDKRYAIEKYPELLFKSNLTKKKNYLDLLKSCDICIATTGLENSIGWKLAEYVASSKAIVSEKLNFEIPGRFENEKNYYAFETADECVEHIRVLYSSKTKRYKMMLENYHYYQNYLEPKNIVLNSIIRALSIDTNGRS